MEPPQPTVKASYRLMDERTRKTSDRFLESKTVGFDNPMYVFSEEPKLTEFIMETYSGKKQKSQQCHNAWDIDDHRLPIQTLFRRYGTHPDRGLSQDQVKKNQEKYGCNVIVPPHQPSELVKFCKSILLGMNVLLWFCGLFDILVYTLDLYVNHSDQREHLQSGLALIITVLITGCFTYYQEAKSNRIYESYRKKSPQNAVVWRDAKRQTIDASGIAVGDIIEIKYGDWIPADIRIIESSGLKVDNCLLTGESQPQYRRPTFTARNPLETKNLIFFSTYAIQGSAKGVVIRVGEETYMGKLAALANSVRGSKSLLSLETRRIVTLMTTISVLVGTIFFCVALYLKFEVVEAAFLLVGMIVAIIPENISITLTVQLALTAKIMAEKHCYVKNLPAVEGLGSVSAICTEKTGILTQNKQSVAHLWFNNCAVEADTVTNMRSRKPIDLDDVAFRALTNVATLCSRAKFLPEQEKVPVLARKVVGDSSEAAILKFIEMHVGNTKGFRDARPKVCEIPFSSKDRIQVSVHDMDGYFDERYWLVLKGAPERVVNMCSTIIMNGVELEMDETWRQKVLDVARQFHRLGERVLAFCDRRLDPKKFPKHCWFDTDNPDFLDEGLCFVGLISFIDPPKAAVPAAIAKCRAAGIKVVMLSGDHPLTASAVARAVGILSKDKPKVPPKIPTHMFAPLPEKTIKLPEVLINVPHLTNRIITGQELVGISTEELDRILAQTDEVVFARLMPEQKHLIVESLKRVGHIVALSGDKVHDMPAIRTANVGISLGMFGADAAKEVADIILMDDNFATITSGIEDGRLLFENMKKLIRFSLADNIAMMYAYWIFMIFRIPLPLTTLQMILISMVFDVLPAVSLVHECPPPDLMKLKPRHIHKETLLTKYTVSYLYGQIAFMELAAGFCAYFVTFAQYGFWPETLLFIQDLWDNDAINDLQDSYGQEWSYFGRRQAHMEAQSAFLMGIIITQWANAIACKTRRLSIIQKGMQNKLMNTALVVTPLLLCALLYTPGLNVFLQCRPITTGAWCAALPFAFLIFVYDELRRFSIRSFQSDWVTGEFYR